MSHIRLEAEQKLKAFLNNPGFFSILLLGENGTGKEYTLKKIIGNNKLITIKQPFEIGETEKEIEKLFEKDYIIIKDSERLSENQQNILFKALSTTNGEIGLNNNKGLKRIIFTSSYSVNQLRESKEFWLDYFWDRVAQLIVKFPSFKDFSTEIKNDFLSVWKNMSFIEYPKPPEDVNFKEWLKTNCGTFAGNYRDLDKIAILWHQYRIIEYKNISQKFKVDIEDRVFRKVRADFENFAHFPTQKSDTTNIVEFEKGKTWEHIERTFKSKFKAWAKESYGTIKNATEELKMPSRKMDKW